ncbi:MULTISPECIES: YaeQ family protein [unclassified Vibrio]|uniref:YaeQ family protein n=1 Tax=unclassified Vibrio TaxID=2614977 RepID=UPI001361CBA0|nr:MULTISPECIES: YaeQ family protein [unclassified Vibrio]NAW57996.1 hypothetical protein [Vibrio sp. V36_P2S2PM302]NAX27495.1 hypothetical protein [Vibrio sp. V38_P2S17PM301]NAX29456.1 hypothetical protein [Vibrio sp. V37_P2S8PM304]
MALKPTIYKFRIALTDMNRDYYDTLNLTVAQHPSENTLRMMARLMAYCLHAGENLQFTKGLSTTDEPDIWRKSLDEQIELWIELGEPDADRVKKATRQAKQVVVYSYNSKSNVWWEQNRGKLGMYDATVMRFNSEQVEALETLLERSVDMSVMISGNSLFVDSNKGSCEVTFEELQSR